MPAPERNQWLEAWEATRERADAAREQIRQWWEDVRQEPSLFWQTVAIRYIAYALVGLAGVATLRTVVGALQPPDAGVFQPRATTANFDVICYNPDCGKHFVIKRKFRFHKFPVTCPFCKQKTGQHALRCSSDTCRGKLVITVEEEDTIYCTECDAVLGHR